MENFFSLIIYQSHEIKDVKGETLAKTGLGMVCLKIVHPFILSVFWQLPVCRIIFILIM